jgi:hypothetical protein
VGSVGSVCVDYRVDVLAAAFGQCKCGLPKAKHAAAAGPALSLKERKANEQAAKAAAAEAAAAEAAAAEAAAAKAAAQEEAESPVTGESPSAEESSLDTQAPYSLDDLPNPSQSSGGSQDEEEEAPVDEDEKVAEQEDDDDEEDGEEEEDGKELENLAETSAVEDAEAALELMMAALGSGGCGGEDGGGENNDDDDDDDDELSALAEKQTDDTLRAMLAATDAMQGPAAPLLPLPAAAAAAEPPAPAATFECTFNATLADHSLASFSDALKLTLRAATAAALRVAHVARVRVASVRAGSVVVGLAVGGLASAKAASAMALDVATALAKHLTQTEGLGKCLVSRPRVAPEEKAAVAAAEEADSPDAIVAKLIADAAAEATRHHRAGQQRALSNDEVSSAAASDAGASDAGESLDSAIFAPGDLVEASSLVSPKTKHNKKKHVAPSHTPVSVYGALISADVRPRTLL